MLHHKQHVPAVQHRTTAGVDGLSAEIREAFSNAAKIRLSPGLSLGDEFGEFCEVDVASADYADDFAGTALAGQACRYSTGSGAFSDDSVALGDEAHGAAGFLESGDDRSGEEMMGESPHAWEDGLASASVDEAGLPVGKFLR